MVVNKRWFKNGTAGHELAIRFNEFFTASHRRSVSAVTSVHKTTSDVEVWNSSLFLSDEDPRKVNTFWTSYEHTSVVTFTSRSSGIHRSTTVVAWRLPFSNESLLINFRNMYETSLKVVSIAVVSRLINSDPITVLLIFRSYTAKIFKI